MKNNNSRKNTKSLNLIKELSEAFGPSGCEGEIREIIRKHMPPSVKIFEDKLGSIICRKDGAGSKPKIMLDAHIDEIGFMVSCIDNNGYLKIVPLGGWWPTSVVDKKWIIQGKQGKKIGISNCFNAHIIPDGFKKSVELKDLFIDIGMRSKADVIAKGGISIGDFIVPDVEMFSMTDKDFICGKALDDRLGCALLIDIINQAYDMSHPNILFAVGASQEEVGCRGIDSALNYVQPDAAIVLEIIPTLDYPGNYREDLSECKLGNGPVIHLLDSAVIANRPFVKLAEKIAKDKNIPIQYWTSPGVSNDGGRIQRYTYGVPTLVVALPIRYMHGHLGLMHMNDYTSALQLLEGLIQDLDIQTVNNLSHQ